MYELHIRFRERIIVSQGDVMLGLGWERSAAGKTCNGTAAPLTETRLADRDQVSLHRNSYRTCLLSFSR